MYRGFKLTLQAELHEEYTAIGSSNNIIQQHVIKEKLGSMSTERILNGTMIEAEWFPQIEADVFISHSHMDESEALSFAGWLKSKFNLKPFIDSAVWKNAKDLLKLVDNRYCLNEGGKTYDYQRRNRTTSHIHMMLNAALMKMMDNTECFFLINTPNAITTSDIVEETYSPWLYSELSMSKMLRIQEPNRIIEESRTFAKGGRVELIDAYKVMKHKADTRHLMALDLESLKKWEKSSSALHERKHALDILYTLDDAHAKPKGFTIK